MKIIYLFCFLLLAFSQFFLFTIEEYKYQFILFELSYILIIVYVSYRFYFMSAISLFIFITFFYLSAGSLDLFYFNNSDNLNAERMGLLLLFGYFFIYVLILLWSIFENKFINFKLLEKVNNSLANTNYSQILYRIITVFLLFMIVLYIGKFLSMYGFSIGGVSRGDLYNTSNFILVLAKVMIPQFIIIYVWLRVTFKSKNTKIDYLVIFFIFLFIFFDMFFKGDRRVTLSTLMAIGGIYYYAKALPKQYIFIGIGGIIFLSLLGAIRNRPISVWADNIEYYMARDFAPSDTEFGPFSMIANYLMKDDMFLTMPTLFSSFPSVIPGFLYPERPIGSSVWFVKTYFEDYYNSGGGFAFNIIIDAALNFGYFAPIVLAIIYFLLFFLGKQKGVIGVLLTGLLIYSLTFTARFDFLSIWQSIIHGWIFVFLVFLFALFFVKYKYNAPLK